MRKFVLAFVIMLSGVLFTDLHAQPTVLGTQIVNGSYTTYDLTDYGVVRKVRLQAASSASSGTRTWEFATGTAASPSYTTNWRPYDPGLTLSGYDTRIDPSALASARYNTGFGGSSGLLPAVTSGNYYTFIIGENTSSNNVMSVLETTYEPVNISSVTRQYDPPNNIQNNEITVTLSGAKNSAEKVFVRYTTNNWSSSQAIEITSFNGSNQGIATIPMQPTGTVVQYYALTTEQSSVDANTIDYLTLTYNNNNNSNYSYTVTDNGSTTYHTITIDGANIDWRANERFDNLTDGVNGEANELRFTWDADNFYFYVDKIGNWNSGDNLIIYLDSDGNNSNNGAEGINISDNIPTLPINYDYAIFIRPGTSAYDDIRTYSNRDADQGASITQSFNDTEDRLEFRIPRTSIGSPSASTTIRLFAYMTVEGANNIFTTWPSTGHDISGTSDGATNFSTGGTVRFINATVGPGVSPNADGILPVELTSFTVRMTGTNVKLNWATASEIDNFGFEIERTLVTEGQDNTFSKIGFVEGNGTVYTPKEYTWVDNTVNRPGKYQYRLKQIDTDGDFEYSDAVEVVFEAPKSFELSQNYPNPFNPSTRISFTVPVDSRVKISVFNAVGELIKVLEDGIREAGYHSVVFDAASLPSGMYYYRLEAGDFVQSRKMLLIK